MRLNETTNNFIFWYSTATEEDLKIAKSLRKETLNRLMLKYVREIGLMDKPVRDNQTNIRQAK